MESIYMLRSKEFLKARRELEKNLNIKLKIINRRVTVEGDSVDEYEAMMVLGAINFGFSALKALQLLDEETMFKKIHIHEHTKRNLKDVLSRLIGTHGKTKEVIEQITGCDIVIGESDVGIICDSESIDVVTTAIVNIIKGSKQSNIYAYLEKMNKVKSVESLGLKK